MNTTLLRIVILGGGVGCGACAAGGGEPEPPVSEDLVDDLEDGDDAIADTNGRLGGWYTFHDDTATGTQVPPDSGFTPTAGGADDSAYAAATSGGGFTVWGAGMGFDLNNPEAVGETGPRGTYDVSAYRGLTFKARGNVTVRVAVETVGVTPTDRGGTCTVSTTMGQECDDLHGIDLRLTDEWTDYQIELADLRQQGWGKPVPFEGADTLAVLFMTGASLDFDVAVDDVRLYE